MPKGKSPGSNELKSLLKHPDEGAALLRDKARDLEEQAARLRLLAGTLQQERCHAELIRLLAVPDKDVDLLRAALVVARLDNEELDVDDYVQEVARMAKLIASKFAKDAAPADKLAALNRFLCEERGFHGSRTEYYARSNSYVNEVIDDREGLPLTLSVLYMELARRLDLPVVGVALPGHFVVRFEPAGGPNQLIDVFERAKYITAKDAEKKVLDATGEPSRAADFTAVSKKAIVVRMIHNLVKAAQGEKDLDGMLRYLDALVAVDADAHRNRMMRAFLRFQSGQRDGALADCEYLLEREPVDIDIQYVRNLRRLLKEMPK